MVLGGAIGGVGVLWSVIVGGATPPTPTPWGLWGVVVLKGSRSSSKLLTLFTTEGEF